MKNLSMLLFYELSAHKSRDICFQFFTVGKHTLDILDTSLLLSYTWLLILCRIKARFQIAEMTIGALGQVWCLIVSIPDLCPLS